MIENVPLTDLIEKVVDNRGRTCPTSDAGIPLIATNCVKNASLYPVFEKIRHVSKNTYDNWFRGHPMPNDIIFVLKGSPGQVCLAPDPVGFCIAQDMVAVRANSTVIYPPYLFAALRSVSVQNDIMNMHVGTMIPHFKKGDFDKLKIPVPDFPTQKFIGDAYMLLSKKVELSQRISQTLDRMARAIFKDWFVDFGPTRAKMAGIKRYVAVELWDLFPERMNEDGNPEGWQLQPLLHHAALLSGGTPKTEEPAYWNGPVAWASAKDVSQCSEMYLISTERSITDRGLQESATRIIPKHSTAIVARGATTGRNCLFGSEMAMNQTCYALSSSKGRPFWLNCAFNSIVDRLIHGAHGSVFDTITTSTFQGIKIVVSEDRILDVFEETVRPLFVKALANTEESRCLAATRDLLLPKLMSGEFRIERLGSFPLGEFAVAS